MSNEVQLYLSARRPGGHDDADPAIAEALAKASTDPALGAWATDQQRVDAAVALKLAEVDLPPGLRGAIIAGGKVSRRTWWRWMHRRAFGILRYWEVVAIAAILMVCAVLSLVHFFGGDPAAGNWQQIAAGEVARIESGRRPLDQKIKDMESIRRWLTEQRAPAPGNLPAALVGLRAHGCSITHAGKEQVSIVCFPIGGKKEVHLVTISRSHLRSSPPEGSPRFETIDGFTTAAWSDGALAMMLIGKVDESDLRNLFAAKTAAVRVNRGEAAGQGSAGFPLGRLGALSLSKRQPVWGAVCRKTFAPPVVPARTTDRQDACPTLSRRRPVQDDLALFLMRLPSAHLCCTRAARRALRDPLNPPC